MSDVWAKEEFPKQVSCLRKRLDKSRSVSELYSKRDMLTGQII